MFQPPPAQLLECHPIGYLPNPAGQLRASDHIPKVCPRIALGGYFKPAERSSKTFNQVIKNDERPATRNEPFLNPNCFGHTDGGQEYYIKASCEEEAIALMQEMFPHDTAGFTSELWKPDYPAEDLEPDLDDVTGLGRLLPQRVGLLDCRVPEVINRTWLVRNSN